MQNTAKSLIRLDLISISFIIAFFAALLYPHKAIGGGVLLDGKAIITTLLFSAFALFASGKLSANRPILEKTLLSLPLATLTGLIVISSLFAQNRPIALEEVILYLAYLSCFYMFLSFFKYKKQQVVFSYFITTVTVMLCLWGLVHFYLFNLRIEKVYRLHSTFGNSNQMAGFLAMTISVYVGFLFSRKFSRQTLLMLICILILMITTLLFTFSRGGWIATFTGVSFILFVQVLFKKYRLKTLVSYAFPALLVIFVFFISSSDLVNRFNTMTQDDTEVTLYGRHLAWTGTVEMIQDNPITGVGPGNYSKAFRAYQPPGLMDPYMFAHNDYLHFISETGVLLIPVIIWMLYRLFLHGFQKIQNGDRQIRGITLGAMGGIVAILVHSISDFNLHIPANALLFTVLAAIVVAPGMENESGKMGCSQY